MKWYGRPHQTISLQIWSDMVWWTSRLSSTNFTWSILECFVPYVSNFSNSYICCKANPYAVSFAINRLWGVQSESLERLVDSAPTNKFLSKFKICFLSFWLGVGVFQVDLNDLQVSEFECKKLWFAKWKTDLPIF